MWKAVMTLILLSLGMPMATPPPTPTGERIRVLLSYQFGNLGFSDLYFFPALELQSLHVDFVVRSGSDLGHLSYSFAELPRRTVRFTVKDGKLVAQNATRSFDLGAVAVLEPLLSEDDEKIRYKLLSTKRGAVNPEYPGKLVLSIQEGKIAVVNDVSMESYLARVIPSEMPDTFHPEALKAQAVAARTYALARILAPPDQNRWKAYGADVDDSVNEQVYNNTPTVASTDAAVRATEGLVLLLGGVPITTNYFSTSPGFSANIEEVWPEKAPVPYLISRPQSDPVAAAPQNEAEWLAFFKNWNSTGFFDKESSLFRWKVTMSREELEAILSKSLPERLKAFPEYTQTLEGLAPDTPNFSIGTLRELRVTKRAAGGYVVGLEVVGSNGRWQIRRESQVRFLLRPSKAYSGKDADIVLERINGRKTANFSSLPSAAFSWEEERDTAGNLLRLTIWGGGFGHGVGMSQFGADGLGKLGRSFEQILAHFYPGTELKKLR